MAVIDTADNIALCNQSLGYLGAQEIVLNGSSANHGYCVTFFEPARDEILALHKWNFAKKRAYAIETTTPIFGRDSNDQFTKPDDAIRIWRIGDDDQAKWEVESNNILTNWGETAPDYNEDGVDYLAGQYIKSDDSGSDLTYKVDTAFTSSSETSDLATYCTSQAGDFAILKVEYVYQYTTPADWPVYVQTCFIYNLALKIGPAIKNREERTFAMYGMLFGSPKTTSFLQKCKSMDAQESGGTKISTTRWVNSRQSGVANRANVGIL